MYVDYMEIKIPYEKLTKSALIKAGVLSEELGITFGKACSILLAHLSEEELTQEAA